MAFLFHTWIKDKHFLKAVGIYTFTNFFVKSISFFLLFYFTRVLSESDYGTLSLFTNSIIFMMPFIGMGFLQSVGTEFFKLRPESFRNLLTTTLAMALVNTFVVAAICFLFRNLLYERFGFPLLFVVLIPVITLFTFLTDQLTLLIRNNNEPKKYLQINVARLVIEIGIAVVLISLFNYGWIGRVGGIFVSYLAIMPVAYRYFKQKKYIPGKFEKRTVLEELRFGLPLVAWQFSVFCLASAPVYFIQEIDRNLEASAVFSVAVVFASIITVFSSSLLQYVHPKLYQFFSEPEFDKKGVARLFKFYFLAMLAVTLLVVIMTAGAYRLLKPSYAPGLEYYYIICTGYFIWSLIFFFYSFLFYHKAKRAMLALSVIVAAVSLTLNWLFVKTWGTKGAAFAMFVSYLVYFLLTLIFVRRYILPIFGYRSILSKTPSTSDEYRT